MNYRYIKFDEDGSRRYCPLNDYDGKISGTGKCIIGLKAWFDENPEKRIELGWIKHFYCEKTSEIKELLPDYDPIKHYIIKTEERVDDYTLKDTFHLIEKSEQMLELEELLETMNIYVPSGVQIVDSMGGAII